MTTRFHQHLAVLFFCIENLSLRLNCPYLTVILYVDMASIHFQKMGESARSQYLRAKPVFLSQYFNIYSILQILCVLVFC